MRYHIVSLLKRFPHALAGIWYGVRFDRSFKSQVYGGAIIVLLTLHFGTPHTSVELILLLGSWALILITELQNSAMEAALDQLHPEIHPAIGISKDMAAGAVLVAGILFAIVVGLLLFT